MAKYTTYAPGTLKYVATKTAAEQVCNSIVPGCHAPRALAAFRPRASVPRCISQRILTPAPVQAVLGPIYTFAFFPCVSFFEGGNALATLPDRLRRDFLPTLAADEAGWLFLCPINYKFVPVRYQLLFSNTLSVLENAGFSYIQHHGFPQLRVGMENSPVVEHVAQQHKAPADNAGSKPAMGAPVPRPPK
jgi:hypothetical protein